MTYNTPENIEKAGAAFLKELTGWFEADGVKPTAHMIENGNDHYDANMAMDAALRSCGLLPSDPNAHLPLDDQDFVDLFNNAWSRAVEIAGRAA